MYHNIQVTLVSHHGCSFLHWCLTMDVPLYTGISPWMFLYALVSHLGCSVLHWCLAMDVPFYTGVSPWMFYYIPATLASHHGCSIIPSITLASYSGCSITPSASLASCDGQSITARPPRRLTLNVPLYPQPPWRLTMDIPLYPQPHWMFHYTNSHPGVSPWMFHYSPAADTPPWRRHHPTNRHISSPIRHREEPPHAQPTIQGRPPTSLIVRVQNHDDVMTWKRFLYS